MSCSGRMNYAGRSLLSFLSFNIGWWACALGPRYQMDWVGPLCMPLWLIPHFYFSPTKLGGGAFLLALGALGFAIDSALIHAGIFYVTPQQNFAPLWLVCMWVLLGLTFESMLVMRRSVWLVMLMGVLSGPLSYLFAQAVNILNYHKPYWITMGAHGLLWAALMPFLFTVREWMIRWGLRRRESRRVKRAP